MTTDLLMLFLFIQIVEYNVGLICPSIYSGFLYNRGDGINVVMDKKVEILIMVS